MAYDSSKPVTGGALVAADVRENQRALKEDQIVDAGKVKGLVADFTSSKATNGYQKLPGGLIIQWGVVTYVSDQVYTIDYPIPFPNAVFIGIAQMINDDYTKDQQSASWYPVSNSQCKIVADGIDSAWVAIGY